MDSPTEEDFDRLTRRLTKLLHAPVALVTLVDADRQFFKSGVGVSEPWLSRRETPLSHSFCQYLVMGDQPLLIEDARTHELVRNNPAIVDLNVIAYAGAPLRTADGQFLGGFCVIDSQPRVWTEDEVGILLDLAAAVMAQIELRAARRALEYERQTRTAALETSSRRLDTMLESVTDSFFALDPEWRFTYANAAAERVLRRTRLELLGQTLWSVCPKAVGTEFEAQCRRAAADWVPVTFEAQYPPLDVWVEVRVYPSVEGLSVYLRDISERKQLEATSRHREHLTRAVLGALPAQIAVLDGHGTIVAANDAWDRFARENGGPILPDAYVGMNYLDVCRVPGGPDVDYARAAHDGIQAVLAGERALFTLEYPCHSSVAQRWFLLHATPLPGEVGGAVVAHLDITERRQLDEHTEEALNALLAMAETLVAREESGDVAEAPSPSTTHRIAQRMAELTCRVLGGTRAGLLAIEPDSGVLRPLAVVGLSRDERAWWAHLSRFQLSDYLETRQIARLQHGAAIQYDLTPLLTNAAPAGTREVVLAPMHIGSRLVGLLAVDVKHPPDAHTAHDQALAGAVAKLAGLVIERERLLREGADTRASVLALQEANRRMNEFLGIASHELKTPVTVIKSNVQLAQRWLARASAHEGADGALAEVTRSAISAQQLLHRAELGVVRLTRLVEDLLEVSRIRAGRLQLRLERRDLAAIVSDVVEEQRLAHPARTIILDLPAAEVPVIADADQIGQVVTNYLANALKYSLRDRPVTIRLVDTGGSAQVFVWDEGAGIPASEQGQIWDLFYRVEGIPVRDGSGVGLGLGLHISRTIVERHDGKVGVESQPDRGSTFWFTLPRAR